MIMMKIILMMMTTTVREGILNRICLLSDIAQKEDGHKDHMSLGSLLKVFCQVMSPHYSDQISQRSHMKLTDSGGC